jgi:hypothetical protein
MVYNFVRKDKRKLPYITMWAKRKRKRVIERLVIVVKRFIHESSMQVVPVSTNNIFTVIIISV